MTYLLLGFVIALAVGLTGIGGGSFTVPALLLIAGLPAGEAVGTTFVFAGVLRLIAAPFYLAARQVHARYFWLLLQGAVPGLVLGMLALRALSRADSNAVIVIIVGALLALSSAVTFVSGVPGVVLGCALARVVPARRLKMVVAGIAVCAGLQLVWSGVRTLNNKTTTNTAQYKSLPGSALP